MGDQNCSPCSRGGCVAGGGRRSAERRDRSGKISLADWIREADHGPACECAAEQRTRIGREHGLIWTETGGGARTARRDPGVA